MSSSTARDLSGTGRHCLQSVSGDPSSRTALEDLNSSDNAVVNKTNFFYKLTHAFGVLPNTYHNDKFNKHKENEVPYQACRVFQRSRSREEFFESSTRQNELDEIRKTAETIASDIILNFDIDNESRPPNEHCKTMRRMVRELSDRHNFVFKGMINKLQLKEDSFHSTFVIVADEMFCDGHVNWGRIVALFTFVARIAKQHRDTAPDKDYLEGMNTLEEQMKFHEQVAVFVGKYIASKLGMWILHQGGWNNFVRSFPEANELEKKLWRGLLYTAIGLGTLAGMVAAR